MEIYFRSTFAPKIHVLQIAGRSLVSDAGVYRPKLNLTEYLFFRRMLQMKLKSDRNFDHIAHPYFSSSENFLLFLGQCEDLGEGFVANGKRPRRLHGGVDA